MLAEVTELFDRLFRELPAGAGTLNISPARNGLSVVELKPTNRAAARLGVISDDFEVHSFGFGERSRWEFPHERRYKKGEKDIATEIEEMSRAVIEGRGKERRGWFSLTGSISVGDYTYEIKNVPMFPLPPFWTRHYAPYSPV